ncbi:MAG TPA: hypothetical protein QF700_11850 [Prochlorococcus sp.]|mgnify:CR=1 FL=1|nr:hypothetical protein [Prochlorococcus sp.]
MNVLTLLKINYQPNNGKVKRPLPQSLQMTPQLLDMELAELFPWTIHTRCLEGPPCMCEECLQARRQARQSEVGWVRQHQLFDR